jgi:hypothetical protein
MCFYIYIEISSLTSKDKRQCTSPSPSSTLSTRNVQLCRNDNNSDNNEHNHRISELQKHIKRTERSFNDKSMQYESQIESYNKKFNEYMIYINIINKFIDNVVSFINSHISDMSLLPFINQITVQHNNISSNDVIGVRLQPEEFRSVLSQIETYIYDITKDAIYSKVRYNKLLEVNNELICNNKVLTEANDITREYDNGKTFGGVQRCDTFNALERRVNVLEKKMQRVNGRGRGSNNSKSNRHYISTNVSLNNAFKLHDKDKPKSNSKRKFKCTVVSDNNNNNKERHTKSALHNKPKTLKKKTKKLNKSNYIDNIITTPNITTTFIHTTTNNKHTRNYTQSNTNTKVNNKYKTYLN